MNTHSLNNNLQSNSQNTLQLITKGNSRLNEYLHSFSLNTSTNNSHSITRPLSTGTVSTGLSSTNGSLADKIHTDESFAGEAYKSESVVEKSTGESLTVSYSTQSDFDRHMIDSLIATGNIFAALKLVNEINELNEYNVINDYHIRYVKDYFLKGGSATGNEYAANETVKRKTENTKIENAKIKNEKTEKGISKKQKVENEYRQLQKAYMKMLSR